MTMNLKEGSRCGVNRDEDLTTVDFDGDVSLAEKETIIRLEATAAAAGGHCWEGKERLVGDQIISRSSGEVGRAASAARPLPAWNLARRGDVSRRRPPCGRPTDAGPTSRPTVRRMG
ncbi:hypothetical protein B296_00018115 [Ensete ventricosum]|uniref:Uncharacterized protein n=1 Tax=Ensete ventricosum TaxID=4639 RepID=A0A427B3G0_ENSVE|nr:hypothetical protein B296_00018115 [Ensete ventricosum]